MSDISPETILNNRYRIVSKLGQGGMGAVYLAYDLSLEHQVAVKVNYNPSQEGTSQFLREARLLANLRHPNLPRVIDYFINNLDQYLVMDYIAGDDLATVIKNQGAQPQSTVLRWAEDLGAAVVYLHRQSPPVIHRDIKPANIKLTLEGDPILVDFGIAKAADASQMTATGAVGYTPGYAPPEQYGGASRTGPYSDQYALAATIYMLLSGQKPEDGVQRVLGRGTLVPLRTLNPSIPAAVDQAIQKAMSIKPDDRFASVSEFLLALSDPAYQATHPLASVMTAAPGGALPQTQVDASTVAAISASPTVVQPRAAAPVAATQPRRPFPWLALGLGAGGLIGAGVIALALVFFLVILPSRPGAGKKDTPTPTIQPLAQAETATPLPVTEPTVTSPPVPGETLQLIDTLKPVLTATQAVSPSSKASLTLAAPATATSSPAPAQVLMGNGKKVAFVSDRADGKTLQIWTMALAINPLSVIVPVNEEQISSGDGDKTQPHWSPNGASIVYVASSAGAKNGKDLWVMDASGANPRDLTNFPGDETDPSWSPDGKMIGFTQGRATDGLKQVYIIDTDGKNMTRISTDQVESQPFWSKDMKYLLNVITVSEMNYLRWRESANQYQGTPMPFDIFTVFGRLGQVANPALSPDGSQIAYTRVDTTSSTVVCTVDYATHGQNILQISTLKKDKEPTWSPDAKWLLFTSLRDGNPELYIMNTAGKFQTRLTNLPGKDMQAAWQP